ncbi:uncharacterized protein TNCV_4073771 [Trichonephila clavipes]|uniref:Uncharacterized protein n=1 Tax=Trichonephila clavipes TaxID=2585209 RepID=A0A8X7BGW0_TRICX|nr:uncharacterized protein TNCV_4073771 [Trichonephila clavipes]
MSSLDSPPGPVLSTNSRESTPQTEKHNFRRFPIIDCQIWNGGLLAAHIPEDTPDWVRIPEKTNVCKCIVPVRHRGTLNSRRAVSTLKGLVEGEERWEAPGHPQGFLPLNWDGTEQNRTVIYMVLKAKASDRRKNSSL